MRVIAGTLGGRRLSPVPGRSTRPTADRVREALFARIESRYGLEGAGVLDLFAGTGALAIEALSRGAASAVCVEAGRRSVAVLRRNVASLDLAESIEVRAVDFRVALRDLGGVGREFDGVFIDPPYGQGLEREALEALAGSALLARPAWVVVETARDEETPSDVGSLCRVREDVYGDTKVALYERADERENP